MQILVLRGEAQRFVEQADGALGVAGSEQGVGPRSQIHRRAVFLPSCDDGVPV